MRLAAPTGAAPLGGVHPAVQARRIRYFWQVVACAVVPVVLGLAISLAQPKPSLGLLLAGAVAVGAIGYLLTSSRLDVSVAIVALYLGILEGPVKLGSGAGHTASAVRDVLIGAVALGALSRLYSKRGRHVQLPPMSPWVLVFVALVVTEAFNPKTAGLTKALGGFRSQLEWVPFFFFGYALMRSNKRFRRLFLILGVIALANGVVGTYQSTLAPTALAGWGPGYKELLFGNGTSTGLAGRIFVSEGVAQVRPPALGTDAGFGGGIAVVALAPTIALLVAGSLRRRWPVLLLTFGGMAAVATGLGRVQLVGTVLSLLFFVFLSISMGGRMSRSLRVILSVIVLAIPVGAVFASALGGKTFSRYGSLSSLGSGNTKDTKTKELKQLPGQLERDPFGVGLARVGNAAGFGGVVQEEGIEKNGFSSETQYNFVADELGLPGLILWVALTIRLLTLMLGNLRRVPDLETRVYLTALVSTFLAMTIIGFSGPTMESPAFGPFFWGTFGISAYWFVERRRAAKREPALPQARVAMA